MLITVYFWRIQPSCLLLPSTLLISINRQSPNMLPVAQRTLTRQESSRTVSNGVLKTPKRAARSFPRVYRT